MKGHRFLVLDGMRGIAAFAVLWGHAAFGLGAPWHPVHAYLAVDFFFALSGFVIAYAYESRIAAGFGFQAFARQRLIRLYPLIFAGAVLGALAFDPGFTGRGTELFWLDASAFLLLPFGLMLGMPAFPVNMPVWSLFFELCANAAYWVQARGRQDFAKSFIFLAAGIFVLGVLAHMAGGLVDIGSSSLPSFLSGFPRVAVSYTIGVLMFRTRLHERLPPMPDFCPALALAALLAVPACGWWFDMACVLFFFPVLLAAGAQARETPGLRTFWWLGGALSYPVYVLHEPVLRATFRLHGDCLTGIMLAVAVSAVLLFLYDEPLRRYLARHGDVRRQRQIDDVAEDRHQRRTDP
jgi:peptidoglycan/LPS O-acetylase OafA/YrhL